MSSNREKLKSAGRAALYGDGKVIRPFADFNPMQQERIITHMHTVGSKEEMRRLDASLRNAETGEIDIL